MIKVAVGTTPVEATIAALEMIRSDLAIVLSASRPILTKLNYLSAMTTISVPKLKVHRKATVTLSLKNMMGAFSVSENS